jgi:hypothetical protein
MWCGDGCCQDDGKVVVGKEGGCCGWWSCSTGWCCADDTTSDSWCCGGWCGGSDGPWVIISDEDFATLQAIMDQFDEGEEPSDEAMVEIEAILKKYEQH